MTRNVICVLGILGWGVELMRIMVGLMFLRYVTWDAVMDEGALGRGGGGRCVGEEMGNVWGNHDERLTNVSSPIPIITE